MALPIPLDEPAITIEAQGRVLKVTKRGPKPSPPANDAKRGTVSTFSRKSRNRLLDLFNRIDFKSDDTKFVTLTFHGTPTYADAKTCLRAFLERLRRKHPTACAVWRMEEQERGSVHFHLVTFGMPYYPQAQLQNVWTDCTGEVLSIAHITKVDSHNHLISYVSKYVAKTQDALSTTSLDPRPYLHVSDLGDPGRWWGIHNRDELPLAEYREIALFNLDTYAYLRWAMKCMSEGYAAGNQYGASLWHEDAYKMIHAAFVLGGQMEQTPPFVRQIFEYRKHGALTVEGLAAIARQRPAVGESVKSLTEALILCTYHLQNASPKAHLSAARKLIRRSRSPD